MRLHLLEAGITTKLMLGGLQNDEALLGPNGLRVLAGIQGKGLIFYFLSQHSAAILAQANALGRIRVGGRRLGQIFELCPRSQFCFDRLGLRLRRRDLGRIRPLCRRRRSGDQNLVEGY